MTPRHPPVRTQRSPVGEPVRTASRAHSRGDRILREAAPLRTGSGGGPRRPRRRTGTLRIPLAPSPRRLHALLIVVAIALSLCAGRLVQLQGFDSAAYADANAFTRKLPLLPARGEITDRNGRVLAATQPAVAVTADPSLTGPKAAQVAEIMSRHLGMTQAELMPILTKPGSRFVYVKKKVPALVYTALANELAQAGIYGVFRESDPIRTYPNGTNAAAVVGYVNGAGQGQAGLERSFNRELSGVQGTQTYESAPNGSKIPLGQSSLTPAQNGLNITTTLDSELQWTVDRYLAKAVHKERADSGIAITMNVKTGEVLALSNAPTFDPADPGAVGKKLDNRVNRAVSSPYEPGSVQKVLTSAALIDSGTANPKTKVVVPNRLPSPGLSVPLKDFMDHPTMHWLMRGVIANSSNIGTALLTRQLPTQKLAEYLDRFGLGKPTGIELPGESAGIAPPADMTAGRRDQVAFGQAVSVTAIQEISAIAGIINGGIYNPPTVIKAATDSAGQPVQLEQRKPRRIVSAKTSAQVRDLLQAVVDKPGGQKSLGLPNYQTGGKTGTAQRADQKCRCYKGYVTSYVSFAPLNDPQLITYVVLTNPRRGDSGTGTAAPVVRNIMNFALPRYSVEPDYKPHVARPTEW